MKFSNDDHEATSPESNGRRELLKAILAGAGAVGSRLLLPALWSAPIIASMPLPAHAALSVLNCNGEPADPPATSVMATGTFIVISRPATGQIKLVVTVPPAVLAGKLPYQVYERGTTKRVNDNFTIVTGLCVVQLAVPTADQALSGTMTFTLPRGTDNSLAYQLRWTGGHTNWVPE